jgi:hypothetical protein
LAAAADAFLALQASAAGMERDFCPAGRLLTGTRSTFDQQNVDMTLFCKISYDCIPNFIPEIATSDINDYKPAKYDDETIDYISFGYFEQSFYDPPDDASGHSGSDVDEFESTRDDDDTKNSPAAESMRDDDDTKNSPAVESMRDDDDTKNSPAVESMRLDVATTVSQHPIVRKNKRKRNPAIHICNYCERASTGAHECKYCNSDQSIATL